MTQKILVTGATGTIGSLLTKILKGKNVEFVAGVRDIKKAKEKLGSINAIEFDFANPATYEQAIAGVNKVFLLGPPMVLEMDKLISPFIDFLKQKKINRVVYVGALGLEHVKELPFHNVIIKKLQDDGFDYTILKPSFFAQNFKNYEWENITQRGITYVTAGQGKVGFIDAFDIANVAAEVLRNDQHNKKTYELTGPEALTYNDAATLLSEVTKKTVVYPNPTPVEYTEALRAAGAPDFVAPYMISVYSIIANNKANVITNDVEKITGKKPTPLREVLTKDFAISYN
jgi:uncharacterized protein YbjT (DUF2867 family)